MATTTKPWSSPTSTSTKTLALYDINTNHFGKITDDAKISVFQDAGSGDTTPFRVGYRRSVRNVNDRVNTTMDRSVYEDTTSKVVASTYCTEAMYKHIDDSGSRIDIPCVMKFVIEIPANGLVPEEQLEEQVGLTVSLAKDKANTTLINEVRMGALVPNTEV